jgi:hypothetical protein
MYFRAPPFSNEENPEMDGHYKTTTLGGAALALRI